MRKKKINENEVEDFRIDLAPIKSMLKGITKEISSFKFTGKKSDTFDEDLSRISKLMSFHDEWSNKYAQKIGLIEFYEEHKKLEKRIREGSQQSPVVDILSNFKHMETDFVELMKKIGSDTPSNIYEGIDK